MPLHIDSRSVPAIAQALTDAGQRLATQGEQAWRKSGEWAPGPSAQQTDPDPAGNRWDIDEHGDVWPVPSDPTGEAATGRDPTVKLRPRLAAKLAEAAQVANELRDLLDTLTPAQPSQRTPGTDLDGWCASCYRAEKMLVPIETDRAGNRYHRDTCRWCGGFKAEHGCLPPVALVVKRHRHGRRISVADVERHCPHCRNGKAA